QHHRAQWADRGRRFDCGRKAERTRSFLRRRASRDGAWRNEGRAERVACWKRGGIMNEMNGKWAMVTGASSGFGIEFASLLAERKANLILAARRTEPMEKLAEQLRQRHRVNVVVEGVDLSVPGAGAELKARLDKQSIVVDILVNNAGFGLFGDFVS